jgi:hypothetical protein
MTAKEPYCPKCRSGYTYTCVAKDCICHLFPPHLVKEAAEKAFAEQERKYGTSSWEEEFNLEFEADRVVHVYETEQYKKIKSFISNLLQSQADRIREGVRGMKKKSKACAYCLDTGWMKVSKMRGSGYDDKKCAWCRDGKDKLQDDQLIDVSTEWNAALQAVEELLKKDLTSNKDGV